jgi:hypothetical protein
MRLILSQRMTAEQTMARIDQVPGADQKVSAERNQRSKPRSRHGDHGER